MESKTLPATAPTQLFISIPLQHVSRTTTSPPATISTLNLQIFRLCTYLTTKDSKTSLRTSYFMLKAILCGKYGVPCLPIGYVVLFVSPMSVKLLTTTTNRKIRPTVLTTRYYPNHSKCKLVLESLLVRQWKSIYISNKKLSLVLWTHPFIFACFLKNLKFILGKSFLTAGNQWNF